MLNVSILDATTPTPIGMLREDGILALHPSGFYDAISHDSLRIWCHRNGRYGLPTQELVSWLHDYIGTRRAIEIGSGYGDLAFHLGIPATDNWCQTFPDVKMYYEVTSQPVIQYPERVEKLDAAAAIAKYQPEIVIGSWVTQWIDPTLPPPVGGGNIYGIKEDEIVTAGLTYIMIGNSAVHGDKRVMTFPHEEWKFSFLKSRSSKPELDRMWVWSPRRS